MGSVWSYLWSWVPAWDAQAAKTQVPQFQFDVGVGQAPGTLSCVRQQLLPTRAFCDALADELQRLRGQSKAISVLDLRWNRLGVPDVDACKVVAEIAQQSAGLFTLRLAGNNLSTFSAVGGPVFSDLKELDLSFNNLVADSVRFESVLQELCVLNLSSNELLELRMQPAEDARCPSLERLDVSSNMLARVTGLNAFSMLHELNISRNQTLKSLEGVDFCRFLHLSTLDVSFCMIDKLPKFPPSLKTLIVSYNGLVEFPDAIFQLPQLVHLEANFIFGRLDPFKKFAAAKHVFPRVEQLSALARCLETLEWNGNGTDSEIPEMPEMPRLRVLRLRRNELRSLPCPLLCPRLEILDLAVNMLEQAKDVESAVESLGALRELSIAFNRLEALPKLPGWLRAQLKAFVVQGNPFASASEFENMAWGGKHAALLLLKNAKRFEVAEPVITAESARDALLGALFGHALGDAEGLATEFLDMEQAASHYSYTAIDMSKLFYHDRHRRRWFKDWTDDTDQMILIMEVLLEHAGGFSPPAFAKKLLHWACRGLPELGDVGGMGLGATTRFVLQSKNFLKDPHAAAQHAWETGGRKAAPNGAVMRTSCLGCMNFADPALVELQTLAAARVTHADPRSLASCVVVTTIIASILRSFQDTSTGSGRQLPCGAMLESALARGRALLVELFASVQLAEPEDAKQLEEFDRYVSASNWRQLGLAEHGRIGYTYKALGAGIFAFKSHASVCFQDVLADLVFQAGDADTNGAVAGALLGARVGYSNLPKHAIENLVHARFLHEKAEQFARAALEHT